MIHTLFVVHTTLNIHPVFYVRAQNMTMATIEAAQVIKMFSADAKIKSISEHSVLLLEYVEHEKE